MLLQGGTSKHTNEPGCSSTILANACSSARSIAGGQSIDLDTATRVVFHERAWTPSLNYQALMRHMRSAKEVVHPVLSEVLAVRGSIDHAVAEILVRKSQDIALLEEAS